MKQHNFWQYIAILVGLCLAFTLTGCTQQDIINDSKSGAVDTGTASSFKDGTYSAVTRYYGGDGYAQFLTIQVHSGIISSVNYTEVNQNGNLRSADQPVWKPSNESNMTLSDVYESLAEKLIRAQANSFEGVNGAEDISDHFIALATAVQYQAETGKTTTVRVDTDDTYTAQAPTADGFIASMNIVYSKGKIQDVIFDETKDSALRSSNITYKQQYTAMSKETIKKQTLDPITPTPDLSIDCTTYNSLLAMIANQRTPFQPQ